MIAIKRLVLAAALLLTLFACGFPAREPVPPDLDLCGEVCDVSYSGNSFRASITSASGGLVTVSFDEPESLSGLVYTFGGDGCKITFGDLSYFADETRLDRCALPQLLCDLLTDAKGQDALTFEPLSSGDLAEYAGELYGMRYIIKSDPETGKLRTLDCGGLSLRVAFE